MKDYNLFIIGSGFIGSELKSRLQNAKLYSHNCNYVQDAAMYRPDLIINAAGITGKKKCDAAGREATFKANVEFATRVAETASDLGTKSLLFSTGAVYANPHSTPKRECEAVDPRNLYVESKIEMEQQREKYVLDTIIFRLPVIIGSGYYEGDYLNRIRKWSWVQSCYISILYIDTLVKAIKHILENKCTGIFNIADYEFHYLPEFVKKMYKKLPVWDSEAVPKDFTQTHLLDSNKARRAGVLK